jgi:hypothetical protein
MKIHSTAIQHLIKLFEVYGGHREEWRLAHELSKVDLTAYERQSSGEKVLVYTSDIQEALKK